MRKSPEGFASVPPEAGAGDNPEEAITRREALEKRRVEPSQLNPGAKSLILEVKDDYLQEVEYQGEVCYGGQAVVDILRRDEKNNL